MNPFQQTGKSVTLTADTTAPTAVQCLADAPNSGSQQYALTNIGSVTVFVGCGPDATSASQNAVVPTSTPARSYPLLPNSQVVISGPVNAYFTGATGSGTAVVYVTPGTGE